MEEVKGDLVRRLRKIEGQVKGIQKMITEEKHCTEILTQITAVRSAINAVGAMVVENHTKKCLINAIEEQGDTEKAVTELVKVLSRFTKGDSSCPLK